ncbi:hypothetical protein ACLB2K_035289 [Fragaria x ananassa]
MAGRCVCTPAKAGLLHRKHRDQLVKPIPAYVDSPSHHRGSHKVLDKTDGDNIFNKYRLGKELGRGESGITHQCVDSKTGETFACKMISKSKLKTEIDIEDVRREAEIMKRLPNHPNIVTFKEAYEDKDAVYLVMKLMFGAQELSSISYFVEFLHFGQCGRPSVLHRTAPTMARLHPSGLQQRPRSLSLPWRVRRVLVARVETRRCQSRTVENGGTFAL